jgi:hypothetical protein
MGLKSLMAQLKNRAAAPSVPPEKSGEGTREPAWIKAVPLVPSVPPHLNDTGKNMLIGQFDEAVNDPEPKPPANPKDWRELAAAYNVHHFKCSTCIAAGRGAAYGLRCGVGAALWNARQNSD